MVSEEQFKAALGCLASGVTIVTTVDEGGNPVGLTVTAFTSVSLKPPLVLVCIDRGANTHAWFALQSRFVVNILGETQDRISSLFASKSVQNRFAEIAFKPNKHRIPVIDGCLATLECVVENLYDGGDHTIFVGAVLDATAKEGKPLLYYGGRYGRLA